MKFDTSFLFKLLLSLMQNKRQAADRLFSSRAQEWGLGSHERQRLRESFFNLLRFWPLFDVKDAESPKAQRQLKSSIQKLGGCSVETLLSIHDKKKPQESDDLVGHLKKWHLFDGKKSEWNESDLGIFHRYLHEALARAPTYIRVVQESLLESSLLEKIQRVDFPENCRILDDPRLLYKSPSYMKGAFEVQDIGSQFISAIVCEHGGEKVLDLCAGSGGKALYLAESLGSKSKIFCFDSNQKKLVELKKRADRLGLKNIRTLKEVPKNEKYDTILLDVPCSGWGTLRRNPFQFYMHDSKNLSDIELLQKQLILRGIESLADSGALFYSTCTIRPEENYFQIRGFLKSKPQDLFASEKSRKTWAGILTPLLESNAAKLSKIPRESLFSSCVQWGASQTSGSYLGDSFFLARLR